MNKIKIPVVCLGLLAPSLVQAGTCMDFDEDFNLVEYECDNTIHYSENDANADIASDFVDTDIRILLRVGISPMNRQAIKSYTISSSYMNWDQPKYQTNTFDTDTGYSAGFGIRISKPGSWFQDIELGIAKFNNLATRFALYDKTMTFDAMAYTVSYNLGYNIYKRFNAYATAALLLSEYQASDTISRLDLGYESSQASTWTKVGVGLEFRTFDWLNLYTEYSYYIDIGSDDRFWVAGGFYIHSLSVGLKALF